MKNKLFLTVLCAIGLCLIFACNLDNDIATASAKKNLDTIVTESERQFFRNQEKSLSILDEAMSPFIKESDRTSAGNQRYCESFAGVFIDESGNLNIGVVQDAISEKTEISMNSLRGQVIYRQDAYSYNFLARKMDVLFEADDDFGIHKVSLREDKNRLYIYLTDINRVRDINNFLSDQGAFDEDAIVFIDDPKYFLSWSSGPAYSGEEITVPSVRSGTIGVNAICNETGKIGVITNEHVARLGDTVTHGGDIIGTVSKARLVNGGTVDASFTPFQNPYDWDMTPNSRNSGTTHTNVRFTNNIAILNGAGIMKIGVATDTQYGTIRCANTYTNLENPHGSGTIRINDTIELNVKHDKGDSGGPVYFNDTQTGTLWLIGIHFAGNVSKTIGDACRITNVMAALNVTPITNDTYKFTNVGNNVSVNGLNITRSSYPAGRLTIPDKFNGRTVTEIGNEAFQDRTGLSTVTIPTTMTKFGYNAFSNNLNLNNIWIPSSVTVIDRMAFTDCPSLIIYAQATSKPAGWHTSWNPNCPVIWNSSAVNSDYIFASGTGASSNPYIITTATHLINVRNYGNRYFKLGSNINLQNVQWTPIEAFGGNFDGNSGNGYTISNLNMIYMSNDSLGYGLFQNNYGSIQNLKVTANINFQNYNGSHVDTAKPVGVIAVRNYGEISNCQVSASGSDPMIYCKTYYTDRVGGITAYNNGNIYSCKNNGVIYSGGDTGGIAGYNTGIILECENNALICYTLSDNRISTIHSIGGIAGINYYRVSNVINKAMILYGGYSQVNDKLLQPRMAHIVGTNDNSVSSASWTSGASVNKGNLISFSWTENGTTYTHNQALYVRNAAVAVQY